MTDKINVTIECGGYTITGEAGAGDATVIAGENRKPAWIRSELRDAWSRLNGGGNLGASNFLLIESETPGKLHKFKGVEYLGLVDAPRDHEKMLKDLLGKFKRALVLIDGNYVSVLHGDRVVAKGCGQIFALLSDGARDNLDLHASTDLGNFYILRNNPLVSMEMIAVAKSLGDVFVEEYERLMKL